MMRSRWTLGLAVLALAFAGCSSDDDGGDGLSTEKVSTVVQQSVGPIITQVQGFLPPTKSRADLSKGECQSLECPFGGSGQVCFDGSVTYDQCDFGDGAVFDGSVTVAIDPFSGNGSIIFDLTIGPASLSGTITITDTGSCFNVGYIAFMSSVPGFSATYDGTLEQCVGSLYPTGEFDVVVSDSSGNYLLEFVFNGTDTVTVNATDLGNGDMLTCTSNLNSGATSCN